MCGHLRSFDGQRCLSSSPTCTRCADIWDGTFAAWVDHKPKFHSASAIKAISAQLSWLNLEVFTTEPKSAHVSELPVIPYIIVGRLRLHCCTCPTSGSSYSLWSSDLFGRISKLLVPEVCVWGGGWGFDVSPESLRQRRGESRWTVVRTCKMIWTVMRTAFQWFGIFFRPDCSQTSEHIHAAVWACAANADSLINTY